MSKELDSFQEQVMHAVSKPTEEKRAYMVNTINQELTASVYGRQVPLPLADAADGCIGVSLWFDTIEQALDYADNDSSLISAANYTTPVKTAAKNSPDTTTQGSQNATEKKSK